MWYILISSHKPAQFKYFMFYIHLRNKIPAAVYEIEIFLPDSSLCIVYNTVIIWSVFTYRYTCPNTLENKINLLEPKLYWRLTYFSLKVKCHYSVHRTFSYCMGTAFYHQLPVKVCHILISITLYTVSTVSMQYFCITLIKFFHFFFIKFFSLLWCLHTLHIIFHIPAQAWGFVLQFLSLFR